MAIEPITLKIPLLGFPMLFVALIAVADTIAPATPPLIVLLTASLLAILASLSLIAFAQPLIIAPPIAPLMACPTTLRLSHVSILIILFLFFDILFFLIDTL